MGTGDKILLYYLWYQPHAEKHSSKSSVSCIQSVDWPEIICHWVCVCVLTGAVRGQSDASAEVHQSLEESSSAATVHPAGFHEDAGEGWTSAHIQTERRLDRTLPVHTHTHTHSFKVDVFIFSYNLDGKSEEVSREKTRPVFFISIICDFALCLKEFPQVSQLWRLVPQQEERDDPETGGSAPWGAVWGGEAGWEKGTSVTTCNFLSFLLWIVCQSTL